MSRVLSLILVAALGACASTPPAPSTALPPAEVVTVESAPKIIKVPVQWYVPIDPQYTRPLFVARYPLWQCPLERDELRATLDLANEHRAATAAIQGSRKGGDP